MMRQGKFVTFEGCDGCGKSTQAELLADALERMKYPCMVTREPGGTALGEEIRNVLLHRQDMALDQRAELLLMMAARRQHIEEKIKPALAGGIIVISDRFFDATMAYQGYGLGMDLDWIEDLHARCLEGFMPDLTLFLDRDLEEGLATVASKDRIESRSMDFHRKVLEGYRLLAERYPKRLKRVIIRGGIEKTHRQIHRIVTHELL